jgi:hypothetical protein
MNPNIPNQIPILGVEDPKLSQNFGIHRFGESNIVQTMFF